jgi:secreted PhoX family phosphatase
VGTRLPVTWVDITNPDPPGAEANQSTVFLEGASRGGTAFRRLEGLWAESSVGRRGDEGTRPSGGIPGEGRNGRIFFDSTSGGDAGLGQVWEFRPRGPSHGWLTLIFESRSAAQLDSPDNLCVTPRGGIVLNEDGDADQYLRGLTQQGQIFDFALNLQNDSEWAGSTFSPDGQTMFVNRQGATSGSNPPALGREGMTFAIWGPWERGAL